VRDLGRNLYSISEIRFSKWISLMRTKTGVSWLDAAVEQADQNGFPAIRDRDDCRLIFSRLIGHRVGERSYRALPIPTFIVHGRAKQRVSDTVAYAGRAIDEAVPHAPASIRRRSYVREIG
jgi:hypothetical protein